MPTKNYAAQITVGGALSGTFTAAVGGAQKRITALGDSVRRINAAQANIAKGKGVVDFDALKRARADMRGAEAEVVKLRQAMAASKGPTREMANALAKAELAAAKAKTKFSDLRESQLKTLREVKAATGSYRVNADTVSKLGAAAERASAKIARLRKGGEQIAKVGSAFRSAASEVAKFGVVAAGAATAVIGAAAGLAKSFSDAGDGVAVTATKIGITTDALQQFRYIGALSGVTAEDMDNALGKLSVRMAKAGIEGDAMAEQLGKLGLGLNITKLRAMGPEKAMLAIADAMQRTTDPAKKLALATIMFGDKAGPKMIGVLSNGRKGMRELAAEARKVGAVMDKDMIGKAQELDDAWDRAGATFTGIKNIVGAELAPVVTKVLGEFVQWAITNREKITEMAQAFGRWLGETAPKVIDAVVRVGGAVASLVGTVDRVIQATVGWQGALVAIAAVMATSAIVSVVKLGVAVATGVAWLGSATGATAALGSALTWLGGVLAAVTAPVWGMVAAIGAAVAAVGYLGYVVYQNWEGIKEATGAAIDWCGEKITGALDWWKEKFTGLGAWIGEFWDNTIGRIKGAWDTVAGFFGSDEQPAAQDAPASPGRALPRPAGVIAGAALAAGAAAPGVAMVPPPAASLPPPAVAAAAAPAPAGPVTFNIQGAAGQDPKAIAAEVNRILQERERQARRGGMND